jgi:hypothetical protein
VKPKTCPRSRIAAPGPFSFWCHHDRAAAGARALFHSGRWVGAAGSNAHPQRSPRRRCSSAQKRLDFGLLLRPILVEHDPDHDHRDGRNRQRADHRQLFEYSDNGCPPASSLPPCHIHTETPFGPQRQCGSSVSTSTRRQKTVPVCDSTKPAVVCPNRNAPRDQRSDHLPDGFASCSVFGSFTLSRASLIDAYISGLALTAVAVVSDGPQQDHGRRAGAGREDQAAILFQVIARRLVLATIDMEGLSDQQPGAVAALIEQAAETSGRRSRRRTNSGKRRSGRSRRSPRGLRA